MSRSACICALSVAATFLSPARAVGQAAVAVSDSIQKYRFLGKDAREKDEHAAVVRYYGELAKYDPGYRPAHYYMGRAYLALGKSAEAKRSLLASSALDSTHVNTALSLYDVYKTEDAPDSAWVYLSRLLRDKPDDAKYLEYRRHVADLFRRQGDLEAAIGHYAALAESPALSLPAHEELLELLAVLCSDRGDAAAALKWRQRLVAVGGTPRPESLSEMADLQIQMKDFAGAHQTLRALARADSAGRYAIYHRIADLGDLGADRAVRLEGLEGMARAQPQDLETVIQIVQFHLSGADLGAAGEWIDRGLKASPAHAQLQLLSGDLLDREGSPDAAVAAYERAMTDPDWAQIAQQRIWKIRPPETEEEKLKRAFFGGRQKPDGGG